MRTLENLKVYHADVSATDVLQRPRLRKRITFSFQAHPPRKV
jgi:hypothetical protein